MQADRIVVRLLRRLSPRRGGKVCMPFHEQAPASKAVPALCCPMSRHNHGRHPAQTCAETSAMSPKSPCHAQIHNQFSLGTRAVGISSRASMSSPRLAILPFSCLTQPRAVIRIDLRLPGRALQNCCQVRWPTSFHLPKLFCWQRQISTNSGAWAPLGTHTRLACIALLADDHLLEHHLCVAVRCVPNCASSGAV